MTVMSFNSPEEMRDYLALAHEQAMDGLHFRQRDITFGDCWVRFVDLDNRVVEFGYVYQRDEVAMSYDDAASETERDQFVALIEEAMIRQGMLYGEASSLLGQGVVGYTHKAHVWPIELRLHQMAADVDWRIERLDETGRLLLELAFREMRAHVVGR